MDFHLYTVSGYQEAIMSLRMSRGKFFSFKKALEIQNLVYALTNAQGFLATEKQYRNALDSLEIVPGNKSGKITGNYETDVNELKRLLNLVMDNAMGHHDHSTLMSYIDLSFFTEGLHRGAQDYALC